MFYRDADKRKHQMAKLEKNKSEDAPSEQQSTNSVDDTTVKSHIIKNKDGETTYIQPRRRVRRIIGERGQEDGKGAEGELGCGRDKRHRAKSSVVRQKIDQNVSPVDVKLKEKKRGLSAKVYTKHEKVCRSKNGSKGDKLILFKNLPDKNRETWERNKTRVDLSQKSDKKMKLRTVWTSYMKHKAHDSSTKCKTAYDHSIWYNGSAAATDKMDCKQDTGAITGATSTRDDRQGSVSGRLLRRDTYRDGEIGYKLKKLLGAWGK